MEHLNTDGVHLVGEVESRTMREARVAEDYRNARASAATEALAQVLQHCSDLISRSGPYDDTRSLLHLQVWLADKIREVQAHAQH